MQKKLYTFGVDQILTLAEDNRLGITQFDIHGNVFNEVVLNGIDLTTIEVDIDDRLIFCQDETTLKIVTYSVNLGKVITTDSHIVDLMDLGNNRIAYFTEDVVILTDGETERTIDSVGGISVDSKWSLLRSLDNRDILLLGINTGDKCNAVIVWDKTDNSYRVY